jgi:hypothetical protein
MVVGICAFPQAVDKKTDREAAATVDQVLPLSPVVRACKELRNQRKKSI